MAQVDIDLVKMVQGFGMDDLRVLKSLTDLRLKQLESIELDDHEKEMLGEVGSTDFSAQIQVIKHLRARTGLDLKDAKTIVQGWANGSSRQKDNMEN